MLIEISIGEALDRLSILEIKLKEISCKEKLEQIQKEINTFCEIDTYKEKYRYYYDLMVDINMKIWKKTDIIKGMKDVSLEFAELANEIFNLNQSRFRVKNIINKILTSNINEQKSYNETLINIRINTCDIPLILEKLTELSLTFDKINILTSDKIQSLIISNIPRFNFVFISHTDKEVDMTI